MKGLNKNLEDLREYICDCVCGRIQKDMNACQTCRLEEYTKKIEEAEPEKKKIKCDVCGFEFDPKKENHYIIDKGDIYGIRALDCFDCPNCGCQAKTKERMASKRESASQMKPIKEERITNKMRKKGWWK